MSMRWIYQLPQEMRLPSGEHWTVNYGQRSPRYSDPGGVTLSQMAEYASTMDARLKLTLSNLGIHTPRKTSLTGFLMQSIVMVPNFPLLKTSGLTMSSFSPHSKINPKTPTTHCKPSRIGQTSVPLGL